MSSYLTLCHFDLFCSTHNHKVESVRFNMFWRLVDFVFSLFNVNLQLVLLEESRVVRQSLFGNPECGRKL